MSFSVSRSVPDERLDLAPLGGDLAGVGEALVEGVAVDAQLRSWSLTRSRSATSWAREEACGRVGHEAEVYSRARLAHDRLRPCSRAQRAPSSRARGWAAS